jgi:hypothetical protein
MIACRGENTAVAQTCDAVLDCPLPSAMATCDLSQLSADIAKVNAVLRWSGRQPFSPKHTPPAQPAAFQAHLSPNHCNRAVAVLGFTGMGSGCNVLPSLLRASDAPALRATCCEIRAAVERFRWPQRLGSNFDRAIDVDVDVAVGPWCKPHAVTLSPDGTQVLVTDWGNERVVVLHAADGSFSHVLTDADGDATGYAVGIAVTPCALLWLRRH